MVEFHFLMETNRNLLASVVLELWSNMTISTAYEMNYSLLQYVESVEEEGTF